MILDVLYNFRAPEQLQHVSKTVVRPAMHLGALQLELEITFTDAPKRAIKMSEIRLVTITND